MSMLKLSDAQLASERAHYQAEAARSDLDGDARRVVDARLQEIDGEEARRRAHPNGHFHWRARYPLDVLKSLVEESGCKLTATADGVLSIFDPSLGFATGGGTIARNGVVANFGFNARYLKSGQIQGQFLPRGRSPFPARHRAAARRWDTGPGTEA